MGRAGVLVKALASGFVLAGAAAIFFWFWPGEAEAGHIRAGVAVLSALIGVAVVVSLWRS
jgi:hypothetical protein